MNIYREYSAALYSLAKDEGSEKKLLSELKSILDIFVKNPKYVKILDSPCIDRGELMGILNEDFFGRISRIALNFIKILCLEHMICHMDEFVREYEKLYFKDNDIKEVTVTTARPLEEKTEKALIEKLSEKFKCGIILKKVINSECIGGIILQSEDLTIDASIKSGLEKIRSALI